MQHNHWTTISNLGYAAARSALTVCLFATCTQASAALAQESNELAAADELPAQLSSFSIDDRDPARSIPSAPEAERNPLQMGYLLMDLSDRAEHAIKLGDHAKAAEYYRALIKAVPERAISYSRACREHEAAGQVDEAIEMCRVALGKSGVKLEDHARFVRVMLRKHGVLTPTEVADVDAVIQRIRAEGGEPGKRIAAAFDCDLGVRSHDPARTRAGIASLEQLEQPVAQIVAYRWALALMEKDLDRARAIVAEAEQAGVPQSAIAAMQSALASPGLREQLGVTAGGKLAAWWPVAAMAALMMVMAIVALRRRGQARQRV
jgi:tetratricopeptide (TPR) repeat protein